MSELKFIHERLYDYDLNSFVNELFEASKLFGAYEARLETCQMEDIILPILHLREAVSSMDIEGTQATVTMVFEEEVSINKESNKIASEINNYAKALSRATDYLRNNNFSHNLICEIHKILLNDHTDNKNYLGKYKTVDNKIVNSSNTVIFTPPSHKSTKKYMDELIDFMNCTTDNINPLIKAAIIHSQFESIHPFYDGNGRVGRILISLYLYKANVISVPFFYISEALSLDKKSYYSMLTSSRGESYDEWIRFFLKKCMIQTTSHIKYIDNLNKLYFRTREKVCHFINTTKYDMIVSCLFKQPILTSQYLSNELNVSVGQAKRYLKILSENQILIPDDKMRNTTYAFADLLELVNT